MRIATSRVFHRRLFGLAIAIVAALVGFVVASVVTQGPAQLVAAWDAGTLTLLVLIWWHIIPADAQRTRELAAAEDPGRIVVFVIDLIASVISFAAAVLLLGHQQTSPTAGAIWFVVAAVVSSWTLMHTGFTFRYAHLFYHEDSDGCGLDFPGHDEPDYLDFAYFSFVIGMTFQTADVSISDRAIRRFALVHSLLAFVFNTMILALAVNLIFGNLAQS